MKSRLMPQYSSWLKRKLKGLRLSPHLSRLDYRHRNKNYFTKRGDKT